MPPAVVVNQLCKEYRTVSALTDFSLTIAPGTVVGLLGPNGAGKSTLLRIMMGFIKPTAGVARVFGYDCHHQSLEVRRRVAYLPGDARLYGFMRGRDAIEMFCGFQPRGSTTKSLEIARRLELDVSRRVMFMSTGMRQKLALSIVLGSDASLLVMDEPTANLDPTVRYEFRRLINELRNPDRTILISSHIFADIEDTCDEVVLLKQGRLATTAVVNQLRKLHIIRGTMPKAGGQRFQSALPKFVEHFEYDGECIELHLGGQPDDWLGWLANAGISEISIEQAGVSALYHRIHALTVKSLQDLSA
jgi:ABC-2 type transport system ATP-binding protein